ncbi:MAG: hypothetical protein ACYS18_11605, partial [Planctomycetota bacterium]
MKRVSFLAVAMPVILSGIMGCALPRNPVPVAQMYRAGLVGLPDARMWEVEYKPDVHTGEDSSSDCSFLALSGGGAN